MEKYEKTIGLKTIWLTFIRRWKIILIIFVPAALATLIVTQFFVPKQYQSSAVFYNDAPSNAQTYSGIQQGIQKDSTLKKAVQYLESDYSITSYSVNNLLEGLSFTAYDASNPAVFKISYTSKQQKTTKPILESISKAALEALSADFPKLSITSPASNPISIGKGKQYLWIGLAASAVLGLGVAFVDEIVSDEVYDEDDLALLGSSSYGLIVSKK